MDSSTVQVTRWKRYGKDRLYVTLADETKVGFWDLVTDEPHPDAPEHLPTILTAVTDWKAAQDGHMQPQTAAPATPTASAEAPLGLTPDGGHRVRRPVPPGG